MWRSAACLAMCLGVPGVLSAQTRLSKSSLSTATRLAPVATTTFTLLDPSPAIGSAMLVPNAKNVDFALGEAAMRAPAPGAGLPGSTLTVMTSATMTGTFLVQVDFIHGRVGTVNVRDDASGAILATCQLVQGLWTAVQGCSAMVKASGRLSVTFIPTAGGELFPGRIVVSQF